MFFVSGVFFVPFLYDNNLITYCNILKSTCKFSNLLSADTQKTLTNSCVPQKLSAEHLSYDVELETAVRYLTVFVFL